MPKKDDERVFQEVLFKWKPKDLDQDILDRIPLEVREFLFLPSGESEAPPPPPVFEPLVLNVNNLEVAMFLEAGLTLVSVAFLDVELEAEIYSSGGVLGFTIDT
jgi:hypothetical protein